MKNEKTLEDVLNKNEEKLIKLKIWNLMKNEEKLGKHEFWNLIENLEKLIKLKI